MTDKERIKQLEDEVKLLQAQIDKMTVYRPNPHRHNYWYYPTLLYPIVYDTTNTTTEVQR